MKFWQKSLVAAALTTATLAQAAEVNVYSGRQEELLKPMLDKFSKDTGIKVNLITGKPDELISRMASEGRNSPADVLISTDVGRLYRAQTQGLLQPIASEALTAAIPAHLRDPAQHWFGLTMRARPVMYIPGKVDPKQLSTLEDLASDKWRGRICIRSSDNIYNQSMLAAMIAEIGEEKALAFAKGLVAMRAVDGRAHLSDLRMGQTPTFSFTFDIGPADGPAPEPQPALARGGRPDVARALPWLWARLKGQALPPPR